MAQPWCRFRVLGHANVCTDNALNASNSILQAFGTDLNTHPLLSAHPASTLNIVSSLRSSTWALFLTSSPFYIVLVSPISPQRCSPGSTPGSLARSWHTAAVHLAATRIWGAAMRARGHTHAETFQSPDPALRSLKILLVLSISHSSLDSPFVSLI
ncbi:hypothetical protein H0H92_015862 [Tricholoma furcatifolium]|nr:hypothetical protein H0H92_015862 [Tricholoma furcatifolium]